MSVTTLEAKILAAWTSYTSTGCWFQSMTGLADSLEAGLWPTSHLCWKKGGTLGIIGWTHVI